MRNIIVASLAILAFAANAFAAVTINSDGTSIGTQSYKTSNNVILKVAAVAGDPLDNPPTMGGFSAVCNHSSGDRVFGVNSNDTKLYWIKKDNNNNATSLDPTATAGSNGAATTPDFSSAGWASL